MGALFRFAIRELLLVTVVVGLAIALFRSEYERNRPFLQTKFLNRLDVKEILQRIAASEGRSQAIIATGGSLSHGEYGGTYTFDLPASEVTAALLSLKEEVASELLKNGCIIEADKDPTNAFAFKYRCRRTAGALYVYAWNRSAGECTFYVFVQESKK